MVGVRFFWPVPVIKLVEIVVAQDTDPETADTAFAFAEKLGKHPIPAKDRSSLIVNFADATYDHQWIHVEHSAKQKPAGSSARSASSSSSRGRIARPASSRRS